MCKAVVESDENIGLGINNGIEYIMAIPYVLLGLFAFVFLRKKIKPFLKDFKNLQ